jgi:hypothetical protein
VLIDRGQDFGRSTERTHDTSEQRLDDLVAQDEVGGHGPDTGWTGLVAADPLMRWTSLLEPAKKSLNSMSGTIDRWPVTSAALQVLPDPGRTHSQKPESSVPDPYGLGPLSLSTIV